MISIVNWLVRDSSSFLTSLRVIVNHTPSSRVIIVFDFYFLIMFDIIYYFKGLREQENKKNKKNKRTRDKENEENKGQIQRQRQRKKKQRQRPKQEVRAFNAV